MHLKIYDGKENPYGIIKSDSPNMGANRYNWYTHIGGCSLYSIQWYPSEKAAEDAAKLWLSRYGRKTEKHTEILRRLIRAARYAIAMFNAELQLAERELE